VTSAVDPSVLPGRLSEGEAYPAGVPAVATEYVGLPSGERVRVLVAGPPDGPTVVLLHGWGCLGYIWRRNLPALASAGVRVYAPELRGHGFSDKPEGMEPYTLAALVDFVVEVLDALDLDRVTLVGHSMSGAIAAEVARRNPERVAALGLLAPVGGGRVRWGPLRWIPVGRALTPRWLLALLPYIVGRWTMASVLTLAYGGRNQFDGADVAEYAAPSQFRAYAAATRALLHAFDWEPAAPGRWAPIVAPTAIAFGTRDRFVDGSVADRLRREMADATVESIPGAGHILPEEVPPAINALILSLVARAAASPAARVATVGRPG
jgi:pimeloyl-ACP methyl ester carboxylesterase